MSDPTYARERIDANPIWRAAFILSEFLNDNAPIGWGRYISAAEALERDRQLTETTVERPAPAADWLSRMSDENKRAVIAIMRAANDVNRAANDEVRRLKVREAAVAATIREIRRTFGSPGDYGYSTPQGAALKALFDLHNRLVAEPAGGSADG